MTSRFIAHENCPSCGSRNNLGVWDDGHKYCFGCSYYEPGDTNIHKVFTNHFVDRPAKDYPYDAKNDYMPAEATRWLYSCGITTELQRQFDIRWSASKQLVCWKIWGSKGTVIGWQGRCFAKDAKTKYVIHGKIHDDICVLGTSHAAVTTLVLVEDYLSAIRVSTHLPSMPLFSCNISTEHLQELSKRFNKVIVWLDSDKLNNSRKIASRASLVGLYGQVLYTPEDPKNYTDEQIKEYLEVLL